MAQFPLLTVFLLLEWDDTIPMTVIGDGHLQFTLPVLGPSVLAG